MDEKQDLLSHLLLLYQFISAANSSTSGLSENRKCAGLETVEEDVSNNNNGCAQRADRGLIRVFKGIKR